MGRAGDDHGFKERLESYAKAVVMAQHDSHHHRRHLIKQKLGRQSPIVDEDTNDEEDYAAHQVRRIMNYVVEFMNSVF